MATTHMNGHGLTTSSEGTLEISSGEEATHHATITGESATSPTSPMSMSSNGSAISTSPTSVPSATSQPEVETMPVQKPRLEFPLPTSAELEKLPSVHMQICMHLEIIDSLFSKAEFDRDNEEKLRMDISEAESMMEDIEPMAEALPTGTPHRELYLKKLYIYNRKVTTYQLALLRGEVGKKRESEQPPGSFMTPLNAEIQSAHDRQMRILKDAQNTLLDTERDAIGISMQLDEHRERIQKANARQEELKQDMAYIRRTTDKLNKWWRR